MTQRQLKAILEGAGVDSPDFEAEQLICHFENVSSASARFGDFSSPALLDAIERRKQGEPLQYILGEWEFMSYPFKVTPDCLIPRADTEVITQFLIDTLPTGGIFVDLCTGSGCIAISALKKCPDATCVAVDKFEKTLNIAKENAVLNGVTDRIKLILADVIEDCLDEKEKFDVIVSNPPYVTLEEMAEITREVSHEPRAALTDEGDGLSIIRKIIEIYPRHLKENGALAIEIGWKQGDAVTKIAENFGLCTEILKDIENRDRVVVIKK